MIDRRRFMNIWFFAAMTLAAGALAVIMETFR